MYRGHIGWTSSKVITRVILVAYGLHSSAPQHSNLVQGEPPKFWWNKGWCRCSEQKTCNISETGQDRTKVTIDDQYEVAYALSIGAKINDLG